MKRNWLSRFLRNRDNFGHTIKLEYKRQETYSSVIGGIWTLLVQGMTLVMVIQAFKELYLMEDPTITSYSRPMNQEDISALIPLNLSDYNYFIAFSLLRLNTDNNPGESVLPPELGTITAQADLRYSEEKLPIELKKCEEVLSKDIILAST